MSLIRANEMVKFLASQPQAAEGFSAREMYDIGMQYGITNSEMSKTFLGKNRAIARGRYLPSELPAEVIAGAAPAKVSKTKTKVAKKAVAKVTKSKSTRKSTKTKGKQPIEAIQESGVVSNTEDEFIWISPDLSSRGGKSSDIHEFNEIPYTHDDIADELDAMGTYL